MMDTKNEVTWGDTQARIRVESWLQWYGRKHGTYTY